MSSTARDCDVGTELCERAEDGVSMDCIVIAVQARRLRLTELSLCVLQ